MVGPKSRETESEAPRPSGRRRKTAAPAPARDEGAEAKEILADNVARLIRVLAWGIGLTVGTVELLNAPFDRFAQTVDNGVLMKIGLLIFYFGWVWGATNDTTIQRLGYCVSPREKMGWKEAMAICAFVAVLMSLYLLHEQLVWFQLVLLCFILVNTLTWRMVFNFTREMIAESYASFRQTDAESHGNCSLAKLLIVVQYMNGPWQRRRFLTLVILAVVQLLVAVLIASGVLTGFAGQVSVRGVSGAVLIGYAPGVLFILYVLISEIWMKMYRIKVFADLNTIDELEKHFLISKRRDVGLPQPHMAGAFDFTPCTNKNYRGLSPVQWAIDTFVPG